MTCWSQENLDTILYDLKGEDYCECFFLMPDLEVGDRGGKFTVDLERIERAF
jgi:hypothetical protein